MGDVMIDFLARFRRRHDVADPQGAAHELQKLRRTKQRDDRHSQNPNAGYATPFDGGQYPGINPGGRF